MTALTPEEERSRAAALLVRKSWDHRTPEQRSARTANGRAANAARLAAADAAKRAAVDAAKRATPEGERRFLSTADAAAYVGVNPMTIRRWVSAGLLTAYRAGPKLLRFDVAELDAMLKAVPNGDRA